MDIVFSGKCTEYKKKFHPESPERAENAVNFLKKQNYFFIEPEFCSDKELKLVHSEQHIEKMKNNNFTETDSPNYKNIYDYARLAAGGAVKAAEVNGFSLLRPPGHHAGEDYVMGFCYFNNIAIAVEYLNKKTLIIDIDCHHGNGTQDIFRDREDIKYISIQKNIYPRTGQNSESNYSNFVFDNIPGDKKYLEVLDDLLNFDEDFEIVAVSAGFDAYKDDPLSSLGLTTSCYEKIGARIAQLDLPVFCVLEGGYNVEKLGPNIHSFISGLESG